MFNVMYHNYAIPIQLFEFCVCVDIYIYIYMYIYIWPVPKGAENNISTMHHNEFDCFM